MSFFGKFLLVLNLIGAGALGWLAIQDYGKRQSWTYTTLAYDLILTGLPVDAQDLDEQGMPLVHRIADDGMPATEAGRTPLVTHLFSGVGGNGVATQADEVKRVQAETMAKIQPVEANPRGHAFALAGILLPFAEFDLEREQYLAARTHLATDAALASLRKRYEDALRDAKGLLTDKMDRTPAAAFRLAFRRLPGLPSGEITNLIVAKLPAKDLEGVNVAALFNAALETQRTLFKKRLDTLFNDAENSPAMPAPDRKASLEARKQAIARLLLGLALGKTGEEGLKAKRRVYVVCGLKYGVGAVSERAAILRQLTAVADSTAATERGAFVADLSYLIEVARDMADRNIDEAAALADNQRKLDEQKMVLAKTRAIVATVTKDRDESLKATDDKMEQLRKITAELLKDRVDSRDLIDQLLDGERKIRELEKQVRSLQGKTR